MSDETNAAANAAANGAAGAAQGPSAQLSLHRIYLKDASFEAPNVPEIFNEQAQPQLQMSLQQKVRTVGDDVHEVVLSVTVTCTVAEKTAYLAEVHQAGLFGLAGFEPRALEAMLGTYCPNALFPYARQAISELVQNGGFPPLFLQPINFEALFAEQMRRRAQQGAGEAGGQADAVAGNG
ncbi:MAG TPA: protein-export chaperone SecB [Xanthomonadaceae bacterium]|nr:protein-export chaperone SecB [Xanthomonadaceae bacterium]